MARSLADRLDRLFKTTKPAGRGTFTNAEAAAATGLSASYIGYLRTGARDKPSADSVVALAKFFGVPLAYFYDDDAAQHIDDQLKQLQAMRAMQDVMQRDDVQRLASRLGELSDAGIAALAQMADVLWLNEHGRCLRRCER